MLFLGILSFLHLTFVPGFLLLRTARYRDTFLASLVYSFALSLLANYVLIYALVNAGIYRAPILAAVMAAEWASIAVLLARDKFRIEVRLPRFADSTKPGGPPRRLVAALLAVSLATVLVFVWIWLSDLGGVFHVGDDVISWDAWAVTWSKGVVPSSEYYPTLLPAGWSLTYVMMGTTDVKLFAKATMPLFSLATLMLFLDRFGKTRQLGWLAGLNCYAAILFHVFPGQFLTSGYADIPVAFAGFLTFAAFLEAQRRDSSDLPAQALPMIFASEAMVVKQGGLFVFALAVVWWTVMLLQRRRQMAGAARKLVAWTVCAVAVIGWWWIVKEWHVATGREAPALVTLRRVTGQAPDYGTRIAGALHLLIAGRAGIYVPAGMGVLLAAGLFHPLARAVFALFIGPFFLVYALFFSYEARSFALAFPFVALCAGGGFEVLACLLDRRPKSRFASAVLAAAILLVVVAGVRYVPTDQWTLDVFRRWPPFLLFGAAMAAAFARLGRGREIALHVRVSALVLLAGAAILLLQATSLSSATLVAQQLDLQRKVIGKPELNRRLYGYAAAHPLRGMIATNYWHLGTLPELRSHYLSTMFPGVIDAVLLERTLSRSDVRYLLVVDKALTAEGREWLAARGAPVEFTAGDYCFIPIPDSARPVRKTAE